MRRYYHPDTGHEIDLPGGDRQARVVEDSGWKPAPDPEPARTGTEPEPVRYEPVRSRRSAPKPKPDRTESDKPEES